MIKLTFLQSTVILDRVFEFDLIILANIIWVYVM